jgi:hypothetical protein
MNGRQDQIVFVELRAAGFGAPGIGRVQCQLGQKTLAGEVTDSNLLGLPGMFAPRYQECFAIGNTVLLAAGRLSDFWSNHPQANRLGSLLTIGHVNSDALGLC